MPSAQLQWKIVTTTARLKSSLAHTWLKPLTILNPANQLSPTMTLAWALVLRKTKIFLIMHLTLNPHPSDISQAGNFPHWPKVSRQSFLARAEKWSGPQKGCRKATQIHSLMGSVGSQSKLVEAIIDFQNRTVLLNPLSGILKNFLKKKKTVLKLQQIWLEKIHATRIHVKEIAMQTKQHVRSPWLKSYWDQWPILEILINKE